MAYKSKHPLPLPSSPDAFASVAAFGTCSMRCSASLAVDGLKGETLANSWRFLVQHKPSATTLWFDLGVSHVSAGSSTLYCTKCMYTDVQWI